MIASPQDAPVREVCDYADTRLHGNEGGAPIDQQSENPRNSRNQIHGYSFHLITERPLVRSVTNRATSSASTFGMETDSIAPASVKA